MSGKRVLILGSSSISYDLDGPSTSDLLQDRLRALDPGEGWVVIPQLAQPGRAMAATVSRLADESQPAVVIISVAASPFTYEFVVNRIRRRWPRLYTGALAISQRLKAWAGGDAETEITTARSLIYRIPEWVAFATIGGETSIAVQHALANTTAALESLVRREQAAILVRLPVGGMRASPARAARYRARLAEFRAGIEEVCAQRHIPVVDPAAAIAEAGRKPGHGSDGIHLDVETRAFEAGRLAEAVLAASAGYKR